jgi:hypothetical protein
MRRRDATEDPVDSPNRKPREVHAVHCTFGMYVDVVVPRKADQCEAGNSAAYTRFQISDSIMRYSAHGWNSDCLDRRYRSRDLEIILTH